MNDRQLKPFGFEGWILEVANGLAVQWIVVLKNTNILLYFMYHCEILVQNKQTKILKK